MWAILPILALGGLAWWALSDDGFDAANRGNRGVDSIPDELRYLTVTNTGLPNVPPEDRIDDLRRVHALLQAIRPAAGGFRVTSGFRSPAVNARVGGAPGSAHMRGLAADIVGAGVGRTEVAKLAIRAGADKAIIYPENAPGKPQVHIQVPESGASPRGLVYAWQPDGNYARVSV